MSRLSELRALAEKATPGPWSAESPGSEGYRIMGEPVPYGLSTRRPRLALFTNEQWDADKANAQMVAEWRNAAPAILAVLEAAIEMRNDPCASVNWGCNSVQAFDDRLATLESGA